MARLDSDPASGAARPTNARPAKLAAPPATAYNPREPHPWNDWLAQKMAEERSADAAAAVAADAAAGRIHPSPGPSSSPRAGPDARDSPLLQALAAQRASSTAKAAPAAAAAEKALAEGLGTVPAARQSLQARLNAAAAVQGAKGGGREPVLAMGSPAAGSVEAVDARQAAPEPAGAALASAVGQPDGRGASGELRSNTGPAAGSQSPGQQGVEAGLDPRAGADAAGAGALEVPGPSLAQAAHALDAMAMAAASAAGAAPALVGAPGPAPGPGQSAGLAGAEEGPLDLAISEFPPMHAKLPDDLHLSSDSAPGVSAADATPARRVAPPPLQGSPDPQPSSGAAEHTRAASGAALPLLADIDAAVWAELPESVQRDLLLQRQLARARSPARAPARPQQRSPLLQGDGASFFRFASTSPLSCRHGRV